MKADKEKPSQPPRKQTIVTLPDGKKVIVYTGISQPKKKMPKWWH